MFTEYRKVCLTVYFLQYFDFHWAKFWFWPHTCLDYNVKYSKEQRMQKSFSMSNAESILFYGKLIKISNLVFYKLSFIE